MIIVGQEVMRTAPPPNGGWYISGGNQPIYQVPPIHGIDDCVRHPVLGWCHADLLTAEQLGQCDLVDLQSTPHKSGPDRRGEHVT